MEAVKHGTSAPLRGEPKSDFYRHLVVYVAVNLMLVVINLVTWEGYFWAVWPLLGWGTGLAIHALRVFGVSDKRDDDG